MRYFYDTEFIEDGSTIDLVSIGIVAEDGREYYAVSTEFNSGRANQWVRDHVISQLPSPNDAVWKNRAQIRQDILDFVADDRTAIDLWAWVGAYDHVVFAQLFGDMSALPKIFPRYTNELKQLWILAGKPHLPQVPHGNHDALVDARHNLAKFRAISRVLPLGAANTLQSRIIHRSVIEKNV